MDPCLVWYLRTRDSIADNPESIHINVLSIRFFEWQTRMREIIGIVNQNKDYSLLEQCLPQSIYSHELVFLSSICDTHVIKYVLGTRSDFVDYDFEIRPIYNARTFYNLKLALPYNILSNKQIIVMMRSGIVDYCLDHKTIILISEKLGFNVFYDKFFDGSLKYFNSNMLYYFVQQTRQSNTVLNQIKRQILTNRCLNANTRIYKGIISVVSSFMILNFDIYDPRIWSRYKILQNGNIYELYQYLGDQCKDIIFTTRGLGMIPGNVWYVIPNELYALICYYLFQP